MTRCTRCSGCIWSVERDDAAVCLLCIACGERTVISDARRAAYDRDKALLPPPGERLRPGPRPRAGRTTESRRGI
jgi:predicted RNA-binding Zn-ribbon protein involved in translation (DUF1610 family)